MAAPLRLFQAFGVELEYMIVASETLDVLPIADELLRAVAGSYVGDVERGPISWSNELVAHVIELKTTTPARDLSPLADQFAENVREMNHLLQPHGARLMPAAMHPWMDPHRETKLWPHEFSEVYQAYDRIFNCQGHGWSNVQSTHINLPFAGDDEFRRLHAAIRLLLPIMPALAASSPVIDRRITGQLDTRLEYYRTNSRRIPSLTADVIPEAVYDEASYRTAIFERMYTDVAPHDPTGVLRGEFLNARGAIARFDRGAIEIRVLDIQECPAADIAIARAIVETLRLVAAETWTPLDALAQWPVDRLAAIFLDTVRAADGAVITDRDYLRAFGMSGIADATAADVWRTILTPLFADGGPLASCRAELAVILDDGPLARRIVHALGSADTHDIDPTALSVVYRALCDCLAENRIFQPTASP